MKVTIQSPDGLKTINLNRRKAIREKCFNCSGWSWVEVERCPFTDCNLFPYRMGRGKQDAAARNKAVRGHCVWCMAGDKYEVKRCTSPHCPLFAFRGVSRKCLSLPENDHRHMVSETIRPEHEELVTGGG